MNELLRVREGYIYYHMQVGHNKPVRTYMEGEIFSEKDVNALDAGQIYKLERLSSITGKKNGKKNSDDSDSDDAAGADKENVLDKIADPSVDLAKEARKKLLENQSSTSAGDNSKEEEGFF